MQGFRPTIARTVNSMQKLNSTKTNATIRNLEEEEGELEEKEGVVVSIRQDLINGAGWTVKDGDGQTYTCSCAASMYELPETKERGGILYPTDTVEVVFTVNPVLRINTIKEIKSLGKETEKLDISKWQHKDESTTIIAKPKSALSISNGFVKMNYDNNNQVVASSEGISTEGDKTNINTKQFSINSNDISIQGKTLADVIGDSALGVSNAYQSLDLPTLDDLGLIADRSNNITQLHINGEISDSGVIGEIRDQQSIPVREQRQLITDGNCIDVITVDVNGVIHIEPAPNSPCPKVDDNNNKIIRTINSTINFITPQVQARNYIKVTVKQMCDSCDDGVNTSMEFVNYCPKCNEWSTLVDTGTSIRCKCGTRYCQNCGQDLSGSTLRLKYFLDNYISAYGTTCKYCNTQIKEGTTKQYIDYCPDCRQWSVLYQSERYENDETINILKCSSCESEYCSSCGINQDATGLTLSKNPVQYDAYKKALRKLKYVKDGA